MGSNSKYYRIGKRKYNGIFTGGGMVNWGTAQIFLECNGLRKGCHDTIAILPKSNPFRDNNTIVDSISDDEAGEVFAQNGWLVKGYNSEKYTRCPVCALFLKEGRNLLQRRINGGK